jgi:hypothetical protein
MYRSQAKRLGEVDYRRPGVILTAHAGNAHEAMACSPRWLSRMWARSGVIAYHSAAAFWPRRR